MKYEILTGPSYALAEVELGEGEKIVTEPGAMAWMDDNIEVETKMKGGLWSGYFSPKLNIIENIK